MEKLREKLEQVAKDKGWQDAASEAGEPMNPYEFSGGNYDDAYQGGYEQGQIDLAKELLEILKTT